MNNIQKSLVTGLGIGLLFAMVAVAFTLEIQRQKELFAGMNYSRIQSLAATAYLKDGNLVRVRIDISTKEDLTAPFMKMTASEFITQLSSKYTTKEVDALMQQFKKDSVKYLGLPCSATFVEASVEQI